MVDDTAVRARTRRAILDAAVAVLTRDNSASLAEIATAAGVGRTTVHRYFPERSHLISAISADSFEQLTEATARARLDDPDTLAVLNRLCQEYFDLGDIFMLAYNDTTVDWDAPTDDDRAVIAVIERGQAEGVIDPTPPATWLQHAMWALLYAAWQHSTRDGVPKHDALATCLRGFAKLLDP